MLSNSLAKPKEEAPASEGKVLATPAIRNLAQEMKVDLKKVKATGKGGRITKDDVLKYAQAAKETPAEPTPAPTHAPAPATPKQAAPTVLEQDKIIKLSGMRKAMTKSMTDALTIPHYNIQDEFNIEKLKAARQAFIGANPKSKITYLPFFIKAFSQAMLEYPVFNAVTNPALDKEGYIYEYIEKADHNISIAVDSPAGLVVPNLKAVQNKSIVQINEEMKGLIDRARKGTLTQADLTEGTFTVSNIGNLGCITGAPVIFRPQTALAATGQTRLVPEFIKQANGEYAIRPREVVSVSLSCDHRVIDGATGARFINLVKKYIENIDILLLTLK